MAIPINNNASSFFFILMDFPGLETAHCWTAIPVCIIYVLSLLGNTTILHIVKSVPSLHTPMYLFLSMLSLADLGLAVSMAAVYLLGQRKVGAATCFVQLFFIHTCSVIESAVLLAMAFDRCVAIRAPLRYATILTTKRIGAIGLASVTRSAALHLPLPVLPGRLQFQPVNALSHSYCVHPDVLRLASSSTVVNSGLGLFVMLSTLGVDAVLILLSYVMILKAVLSIASNAERLKALNTCISHICVVLLFYTPQVSLSMIHRFGKKKLPAQIYMLLSYLHFLVPPMLNPIVYTVKIKEIRVCILKMFQPRKF
ncbi:hypothetical protein G4228_000260 [Cervus hanglu yarkandensis]|nr:hypothetical protein G4228_000260 [Cervus hanglu yarkandensis]